jgi:hypothetical protein
MWPYVTTYSGDPRGTVGSDLEPWIRRSSLRVGVMGKDLSNPIPEWAEHREERKVVPLQAGHRHGQP